MEMRLSQVSDVSRGSAQEEGSAVTSLRAGSPHIKDTEEQEEMLGTSPPLRPGLASYFSYLLGAALPAAPRGGGCCFHFRAAITRSACCWLPTGSTTPGAVGGEPAALGSLSPGREVLGQPPRLCGQPLPGAEG